MNTMFLVYNTENVEEEKEVIAVFNDGQLATALLSDIHVSMVVIGSKKKK